MPWITAILMVVGLAVLAAMYWNRNVTVQDLEVNELRYTTYEEVKQAAAIPPEVKPDSLDLSGVSMRVEKLNYVKSVVPYVEPNGTLRLSIKERIPVALLVHGKDRAYVDAEGVRLPILDKPSPDVPLLYGYRTSGSDTLNGESFKQLSQFLVQAQADPFSWTTLSELAYDKMDGVVALSHENGVKLIFGHNNFELKLENWKAFYHQVIKTKGIDAMRQVDLRFTNQVVTREI
ncbi:Cell division septal protein FtsQ [Gracilimonas mengyeensis]|uniref:Cell division septal protein FtsQ n=2 Tax=Gracilimonas mengyeensis TaxID=1302730 RepID=A0A521E1H4_9BACT|nr:Cell division septal protein FtsQ [Gracilimonas mengyeensis]